MSSDSWLPRAKLNGRRHTCSFATVSLPWPGLSFNPKILRADYRIRWENLRVGMCVTSIKNSIIRKFVGIVSRVEVKSFVPWRFYSLINRYIILGITAAEVRLIRRLRLIDGVLRYGLKKLAFIQYTSLFLLHCSCRAEA